ncbi:dsDNA nuclease domain-containing protein [Paenibacillus ehimensis]|uniref:DsDNA nuclease domain-containing protein n=1 Tax=Paenibacillus ehimensis TaxID=79264 RepID=A0ABT8VGS1_9BACL|nr:dsDNA nuclease domain-containing protein [Paenibacillus ehimensis]MDO3680173.1 dsDNA nuclease domain-containing protein [Paenibacillus ehimensis]
MTAYSYMSLPYDLSGSMSKNRFRNEMLWGLKKILDLYRANKNFTIVFDYKCDIEIHLEDNYEFYQLKTRNDHTAYTLARLIKKDKVGNSILGKLYTLKYAEDDKEADKVVVALVSNAPINDGKKVYSNCESTLFTSMDEKAIKKVKEALKNELSKQEELKLENTYYIRTSMDLINPEKTLIGELSLFFEAVFNTEPKKVNSLYRILYSEISTKASYELELSSYDEILEKKGIGKSELTRIFNKYIDNTDISVIKTKDFIEVHYNNSFKDRLELKKALNQIVIELPSNQSMKKLEEKIISFIEKNIETFPETDLEIVEFICGALEKSKLIEMTNAEFRILVLFTLKRFEEGVYEKSVS